MLTQLSNLEHSFVNLSSDVRAEVKHKEEIGEMDRVIFHIEEKQAFHICSLRESAKTTDELFNAIRLHYNFLNYHLLVSIALFIAGAAAVKATEYEEKFNSFMKSIKIKHLKKVLNRCYKNFQSSSKKVVIIVENGWGNQNIWLVRMLLKTLFPSKDKELIWCDIEPGSIVIIFLAFEHMLLSLMDSSRKKIEFMRLIGIISLRIGNELIWNKGCENKNTFSFDNSLIQATLTNNIEAVQFLLQYAVIDVNVKNKTNSLLDSEVYKAEVWTEAVAERQLRQYKGTFTALLKDIEIELEYHRDIPLQGELEVTQSKPDIPHVSFMNSKGLAHMAHHLPDPLSLRIKHYTEIFEGLVKRRTLVMYITESLEKYINPASFPDHIEVVITLHNLWSTCSIWCVEQMGQLIFTPVLFHQLLWFRVSPIKTEKLSLLNVVFLANKDVRDKLQIKCQSSNDMHSLSLLGVTSVRVDDIIVTENEYSSKFKFTEAIDQADPNTIANGQKIHDLLGQLCQAPVELRRLSISDSNNNRQFLPEPDSTSLMIACCNTNSQLVQLLLNANVDPNIQSRNGVTALMYSVVNTKIFQMILDHGADVYKTTEYGLSVMPYACIAGNAKVVQLLIKKYPSLIHVTDKAGGSVPLHAACYYGHSSVVAEILRHKTADINVQESSGWTALMNASVMGQVEVVDQLLQAQADPSIQNHKGWNPLMLASRDGHTSVVERLLHIPMNLNVQSDDGTSALMGACQYGHSDIVKMLIQARADPFIRDTRGYDALTLATLYERTDIIEILNKLY